MVREFRLMNRFSERNIRALQKTTAQGGRGVTPSKVKLALFPKTGPRALNHKRDNRHEHQTKTEKTEAACCALEKKTLQANQQADMPLRRLPLLLVSEVDSENTG